MFGPMSRRTRSASRLRATPLLLALGLLAACASVRFGRDTETSGTFESSGVAFTLVKIDMPKGALDIARENAADSNLPNMVIEEVLVVPYLGPFDFLLDVISVRYARIRGRWGLAED